MKFQFEGLDDLITELERTEKEVDKTKTDALQAGAKIVQEESKKLAPVRAVGGGTLRENILISDVENDQVEVYVDQQGVAYYGYFHEVGTSKMRARPFMGPAFMKTRGQIEQEMASTIREKLRAFT